VGEVGIYENQNTIAHQLLGVEDNGHQDKWHSLPVVLKEDVPNAKQTYCKCGSSDYLLSDITSSIEYEENVSLEA